MQYFWSGFRTKVSFLSLYLFIQLVIVLLITITAFLLDLRSVVTFDPILWLVAPFAALLGIKLPTLMHNAVHSNFKGLNFLIGEMTSQFILISFGVVCINHTFHHSKPDSDEDPHAPMQKGFLIYLLTCLHSGVGVIKKRFLKYHGDTSKNRGIFNLNIGLHFIGIPLRLVAFYMILGPALMLTLYLPALVAFTFTFAHVNYITHQDDSEGNPLILNKNSNLWYQFVNLIADGIYFHKNHHKNPNLYNPKYLNQTQREKSKEQKCKSIGENLGKISIIS
jgi:fatty acid desaturase